MRGGGDGGVICMLWGLLFISVKPTFQKACMKPIFGVELGVLCTWYILCFTIGAFQQAWVKHVLLVWSGVWGEVIFWFEVAVYPVKRFVWGEGGWGVLLDLRGSCVCTLVWCKGRVFLATDDDRWCELPYLCKCSRATHGRCVPLNVCCVILLYLSYRAAFGFVPAPLSRKTQCLCLPPRLALDYPTAGLVMG